MIFTQENHVVCGLDPIADAFAGTIASTIVDVRNYDHVTFLVYGGVNTGGTGKSTWTVLACDDTVPSNTHAIAFRYRELTTNDTWGDLTDATTAGFTNTAASGFMLAIEVDVKEIAHTGYHYVKLVGVEAVDDPVVGCILAILSKSRYAQAAHGSAID
ncbi:MAG: hypothetical protein BWY79_00084 [Actinobacteria bacterium ADurb.Bin444]|nr:MAG: hypothetical protein BWY79_00084 [Actinobacteria bacterium ADurb.Bin444]